MAFITDIRQLLEILDSIPPAETAKIAVVRPTTHFAIVTADNPDMVETLRSQENFVRQGLENLEKISVEPLTREQSEQKTMELRREFQGNLAKKAYQEQQGLLKNLTEQGIPIRTILEDKGKLETAPFDYFTDQIFATDTGEYFNQEGKPVFMPSHFKNKQRQGEERLAEAQAENIGAEIRPLVGKHGEKLIFEGGDVRQMVGKKLFLIGQGPRSEAETGAVIAETSGYHVIPVKLLDPQFYHLDCCFLPLPNDAALIYEGQYEKDAEGNYLLDENLWPRIIPGTETMAIESRALIRTLYRETQLVLLRKDEASAFATNAAVLQSSKDGRFKMFVNGIPNQPLPNEALAIASQQISLTKKSILEILRVTAGLMDIIEVPYSTMHGSGGSVRCTINELCCTREAMRPDITRPHSYYFGQAVDRLEKRIQRSRTTSIKEPDSEESKSSEDEEPPAPSAPLRLLNPYPFSDAIDNLERRLYERTRPKRDRFFSVSEPSENAEAQQNSSLNKPF